MPARPQLPGVRWFLWLRNTALRTGVLTGIYLSCILFSWLWAANRVPQLEPYARARNLAAGAIAILLMTIPVLRFRRYPGRIFVSGLTAWTLLTITYLAMEMRFSLLETRLGAFHLFMLGAICYGFVAAFQWVFLICAEARHRHLAENAQAPLPASRRPVH
jgi:hypothetical protein